MSKIIKELLERKQSLRALLRPFVSFRSVTISKENKIVDAYIYDWDNRLSANNHIVTAQLDFRPPQRERKRR